ncbi:MAG: lipo-like protein [Pseudomonadales bacterium]|jgi:hypothetical protein|nr:lipo-like protein [Pseudomonadales bacterium]
MATGLRRSLGSALADYLTKARPGLSSIPVQAGENWAAHLEPCDVLLVEGSSRIASAIKYLTQSTWSHAALYVGETAVPGILDEGRPASLIEADVRAGVRAVATARYADANVRICRPVALDERARNEIIAFLRDSLGHQYDLKNVFDLMRYLLPEPPVPARFRRQLLTLGSGEPTRAICSTLLARAFQRVRYPIVPESVRTNEGLWFLPRHHSFVTPRDFDLSPYFAVIKPTLETGFDPLNFAWHEGAFAAHGNASAEEGAARRENEHRTDLL